MSIKHAPSWPCKAQRLNLLRFAYKPYLLFLISDIRALWRSAVSARVERQSARMSEIKNITLCFYGAKHWKRNHMTKLGFKGLAIRPSYRGCV